MPKYYRANQGFSTTLDGEPIWVAKGELVSANHPLLKGREDLFDVSESFGRFDLNAPVEQASAAPGERRNAGRPAKNAKFGLTTTDITPGEKE